MTQGTIKFIQQYGTDEKPKYGIIIEGLNDNKEKGQKMLYSWKDCSTFQKGQKMVYELETNKGYTNIVPNFNATPETDVNEDINPPIQENLLSGAQVVSQVNHTQISIESQSILQRVEGTLNTWIVPETPEEVVEQQAIFLTEMYTKRLKQAKSILLEHAQENEPVFDEHGNIVEAF